MPFVTVVPPVYLNIFVSYPFLLTSFLTWVFKQQKRAGVSERIPKRCPVGQALLADSLRLSQCDRVVMQLPFGIVPDRLPGGLERGVSGQGREQTRLAPRQCSMLSAMLMSSTEGAFIVSTMRTLPSSH